MGRVGWGGVSGWGVSAWCRQAPGLKCKQIDINTHTGVVLLQSPLSLSLSTMSSDIVFSCKCSNQRLLRQDKICMRLGHACRLPPLYTGFPPGFRGPAYYATYLNVLY